MKEEEEQAGPLGSEEHVAKPNRTIAGCFFLVTTYLAVGAIAAVLVPNLMRTRNPGQLTACKANLRNIATALEMYASDNAGNYPQSLDELIEPNYLKRIPTCPAAGKMTYLDYQVSTTPDSFSFSCCGDNHKQVYRGFEADSTDFPKYNAELGPIDHP